MTEPALAMLLERLLWPVPRIRWEVCRSLARLIRKGNENVARSLLDWISTPTVGKRSRAWSLHHRGIRARRVLRI